jgi:hypothetical protein
MIQGFSGGLLNRELIYQTDLPSFQRDFASLKTLDHGTGPSITFTRASDATYFDADGVLQTASNNVARFDHSGGSSLGLLIEEARTNTFQRSAEFSDAYWAKSQVTITANAATAPDGTTTADEMVEDSSNDGHGINRTGAFAFTSGTSYTVSVFVKASSGTRNIRLAFGTGGFDANSRAALFNPHNGTVVSSDAGTTATIQAAGSSYYRVVLTATANATVATGTVFIAMVDGTTFSYTGDNTSSLYLWGAQLETGAFATSYIPTTTAAATRSADLGLVTPISSFYNQAEGTLFAEFQALAVTTASVMAFSDNSTANLNQIRMTSGDTNYRYQASASTIASIGLTAVGASAQKVAAAYATNDFAAYRGGSAGTPDTSGTPVTVMDRLRLGQAFTSAGVLVPNIYIRKVAYWPKRLTNTLLEQLTT